MDPLDGHSATRLIRAQYDERYLQLGAPPPFVIACTANVGQESRDACSDAGMQAFLSKPVDVTLLARALLEGCSKQSAWRPPVGES